MSIYVEIRIRGPLDELWERTQNPDLHESWDLRFSSIKYLPRADESEPQRFLYSTRVGCGLAVHGEGETVGDRVKSSEPGTSSLRFWSDDPKSLIREGAGYWQYTAVGDGIRFITAYDYRTRFGSVGRLVDRLLFRPLIGWATAWSFDRLRLWIEQGIDPAVSMQRSLIHAICRVTVAIVWFYQGLVPKLIARHADEMGMLADAGIPYSFASTTLTAIGWAEVALGVIVLLLFRSRWPLTLTIFLMVLATIAVVLNSPMYLMAAFNPLSLNILMAAISLIGLMVMRNLPTARNCLRKKPENT